MAKPKVSHLPETQKSDQPEFYKQLQQGEERNRHDLNEVGYLVNSLIWIGDKLKEQGNAVDEGVLLKHIALAIADLVESMIGRLPATEEKGGAA